MPNETEKLKARNLGIALYYPSIHFRDPGWIKAMSLLYDRIYRIVPNGVRPDDAPEIQPLVASGFIGKPIDPIPYAKHTSDEFAGHITSNWKASALRETPQEKGLTTKLHTDKTDEVVRGLLTQMGYQKREDWFEVPDGLASNYLLFLATRIAQENNLSLITDGLAPWTASTYFSLDGLYNDVPGSIDREDKGFYKPFSLFTLAIEELVPVNIADIPSAKILEFREKRKDEIRQVRIKLEELSNILSSTKDSFIRSGILTDAIADMKVAIEDYRRSADILNAKKWFGMSIMGFPAATKIAEYFGMQELGTSLLLATGIAVGAVYSLIAGKQEIKRLSRTMPYSAFASMSTDLKRLSLKPGGRDPSFAVRCALDEYIND